MTAISYVAVDRGALASGHSAGTTYDLETAAQNLDPSRKVIGDQAVAEDGTTEGTLDRIERGWSVLTDYITEAEKANWEEFLDSVAASESFTFDAYGTISSPDNPQTVIMDGDAKWKRAGASMLYTISFNVRVL